jgi:rhamnogalacturonan endolyase
MLPLANAGKSRRALLTGLLMGELLLASATGCTSAGSTAGAGTGGATAGTGGSSGTGGANGTGGSGASGPGGATTGTGGSPGAGGQGTGGATVGAGGSSGTGGATAGTGGATSTGGATATGGAPGSGGATSTGGATGKGGSAGTGACSLITQGTDYPGMQRTACPSNATNVPGAVMPGGADVTAKNSGGTMTLNNGIVSIVITCASGDIDTWTYDGKNVLAGGDGGGKVYWELEAGNGACTLTADPTTNGGNQAEVRIHTTGSTNNLDVDMDYTLLRGSSGFYAAAVLSHPASYGAVNGGEWRSNVYNGSMFDWVSLDALRDGASSAGGWLNTTEAEWVNGVAVTGAPKEVERATTGAATGDYICKYSYTADWGDTDAWGWSSSTQNIGMWIALGSKEYYNGGPKKRELMGSMLTGPDLLNMLGGSHYEGAEVDQTIATGVAESKVYGPFFYYNNKVPIGTANANDILFADAIAQAKAEQRAWPYTWFKNTATGNYLPESGRGTVTGTLAISDPGQPNASPADMWIGLAPDDGEDPAAQYFTYQFWVRTAADGSFTIPHVLPGTYALWAFGRGAAGSFTTATTKVADSSILTPFTTPTADVTVTAGQTKSLGTVTVTPPRTAPTVWEIGVPDRDSHEFLNGAINYTYWTYAAAVGTGTTYTVGTDDYAKVWNYADMNASPWTVSFTLANAPAAGSKGRFYLALAANQGGTVSVAINGTSIGTLSPQNQSDAVIRLGSHGYFWDGQIVFTTSALKAGANTLTIKSSNPGLEWDYLRLEAGGT